MYGLNVTEHVSSLLEEIVAEKCYDHVKNRSNGRKFEGVFRKVVEGRALGSKDIRCRQFMLQGFEAGLWRALFNQIPNQLVSPFR